MKSSEDQSKFQRVREGYQDVMGEPSPLRAIGGGTDAKGYPDLIAAGALFSDNFGPPINFHGIDEGAPIHDLHLSGQILWHILLREIGQESDVLSETQRDLSQE